jgi:hypothetical protein
MKPGMQRDLLVAFWFLFDEFEIGEGNGVAAETDTVASPEAPKNTKETEKAKPRANGGGRQRR